MDCQVGLLSSTVRGKAASREASSRLLKGEWTTTVLASGKAKLQIMRRSSGGRSLNLVKLVGSWDFLRSESVCDMAV